MIGFPAGQRQAGTRVLTVTRVFRYVQTPFCQELRPPELYLPCEFSENWKSRACLQVGRGAEAWGQTACVEQFLSRVARGG